MEKDMEDIKKLAMKQNVTEKRDDKKLDWMYKGTNQLINREEYLLGRPIDKSFEQMVHAEKNTDVNHAPRNHVEHECVPPSLRFFSGNEQVDLARKMQEDPLYAIKKKEMETRNQLLKNPVKLKQLRQLLEQQSKEGKSEKKQKKKKKRQDEDSDDETKLDKLLAVKFQQLKDKINSEELIKSMGKEKHKRKKKLKKKIDHSRSESESSTEETSDGEDIIKHKKKKSSKSRGNNIQTNKVSNEKYIEETDREKERKQKIFKKHTRSRSPSSDTNNATVHRKKSKTNSYKNENQGFYSRSSQDKQNSSEFFSDKYNNKSSFGKEVRGRYKEQDRNKDKWSTKRKQNLTEEEKERRRQEMLTNATWRNKERERNVKKYHEEEKKEVYNTEVYNQDFIRKQLVTATEMGTVASRIKSNINNIQRSGRAMDTNFAKR
ncbi:uncharacterized protein LOC143181148 isoform X3 [Calliopsis andreniformis]